MQVLCCFVALLVCVSSQETEEPNVYKSKPAIRVIPADVLRDFPAQCFGSTLCRTFNVTESWSLAPFCGISTCTKRVDPQSGQEYLLEEVRDCGPRPHIVPAPPKDGSNPCPLYPEKFNASAIFPDCCPVFRCAAGYQLEFPKLGAAQQ